MEDRAAECVKQALLGWIASRKAGERNKKILKLQCAIRRFISRLSLPTQEPQSLSPPIYRDTDETRSQLTQQFTQETGLTTELVRLQTELEQTKTQLRAEIGRLSHENAELQTQLEQSSEAVSEAFRLERLTNILQEDLRVASNERDAYRVKYKRLKQKGQTGDSNLQEIVDEQKDEIDALNEELDTLKAKLKKQSAVGRSVPLDEHTEVVASLKQQILDLQRASLQQSERMLELEDKAQELSRVYEENQQLQERLVGHHKEVAELEEEIQTSKQLYSSLITLVKYKNQEISYYNNWVKDPNNPAFSRQIESVKRQEKEVIEV